MKRLYKFLFLLFCFFLAISFIYTTLLSWISFEAIIVTKTGGMDIPSLPFTDFLRPGFNTGLIHSLVLIILVVLLMKRSFENGRKFTLKQIIGFASWFYLITTLVYLIHWISFPSYFRSETLFSHPDFALPLSIWLPFPLAWLTLYAIMYNRIKKAE